MNDTELVIKLRDALDLPEEPTAEQIIDRANEATGALLIFDDLIDMLSAASGPVSLMLWRDICDGPWVAALQEHLAGAVPATADDPVNALHRLIEQRKPEGM